MLETSHEEVKKLIVLVRVLGQGLDRVQVPARVLVRVLIKAEKFNKRIGYYKEKSACERISTMPCR